MSGGIVEKHQLAGLDEHARGFNRVVEVCRIEQTYRAVLQYEARHFAVDDGESAQAALQLLIRRLHIAGFSQLRSQMSFRGTDYRGSGEPWIEYPDPVQPAGLFSRLFGWLRRGQTAS